MVRHNKNKRISCSVTLQPDQYDTVMELKEDLQVSQSFALDLIIKEWKELSTAKASLVREQQQTLFDVKERLTRIEVVQQVEAETAAKILKYVAPEKLSLMTDRARIRR